MDENNKSIIEWILYMTRDIYSKQSLRNKSNTRVPRVQVDKHIKYCKQCKATWYYHKMGGTYAGKWSHNLRDSMPTIGKKRELCPKCKSAK
tara:strand:- start:2549 stop:2821 length:273 start_codon:yes stop_codon:yes gene_type:complete